MSLFTYIKRAMHLLREEKQDLINAQDLIDYINTARGQIAGEAECIRNISAISAVIGQQRYNFSSINTGTPALSGIQGVIHVRRIQYLVGTGQKWIKGKSWEWFDFQRLNNPVPTSGAPTEWAQYGQGASGNFYIDPLPDVAYTLSCDCVCYPINLATDTDLEIIPYLWTDAIPYFAAYLALLALTGSANSDAAMKMYGLYEIFMQRARSAANPSLNAFAFEQSKDPAMAGRFGTATQRGAG